MEMCKNQSIYLICVIALFQYNGNLGEDHKEPNNKPMCPTSQSTPAASLAPHTVQMKDGLMLLFASLNWGLQILIRGKDPWTSTETWPA